MSEGKLFAPLPPGSVIGILGGGQLGRMLSLAAARLGLKCHIYAPEEDSCAFQVAAARTVASYQDEQALRRFAGAVDVITYEFENVPAEAAKILEQLCPLAPGSKALATAQDRVAEKQFVAGLGIAVAPFEAVESELSLRDAIRSIGTPAILKTRRFGYDGKGQVRLTGHEAPEVAWAEIGKSPAILEGLVEFDCEVSVIAARSWSGEVAFYDLPRNTHDAGILRTSQVPSGLTPAREAEAREVARAILEALNYVGVIGIEMFAAADRLLVNEMAPRVHNSGHWTMDACAISQFEQHIRAVCGWPLGDTARHSGVVMHNLLGHEVNDWQRLAGERAAGLHLYGKGEARRGRKMGHLNVLSPRQGS
jgi:5-(carboxyamino)imidazole ribonucleotide synthase